MDRVELARLRANARPDQDIVLIGLLDHIDALEKTISEPVEAFGTPELIAWSQELTRLLEFPEEEHGQMPFVLSVGCHLENFAKRWHSPAMKILSERIEELEAAIHPGDAEIFDELKEIVNPGKLNPMEEHPELSRKTEAAYELLCRYQAIGAKP